MNVLMERNPSTAPILRRSPGGDALRHFLGDTPSKVILERVHFPGKRPIQLQFLAVLRSGLALPFIAEYCPGTAPDRASDVVASLRKSRNGQRTAMAGNCIIADDSAGLVLRKPGLDERLPGMRLLHDTAFARETIARLSGRDPGPVRSKLMAHRLGKRAVLRIRGRTFTCYARIRATKSSDGVSRYGRHVGLWRALGANAALRIPAPLGEDPAIGLSLFAVLPGAPPDFGTTGTMPGIAAALSELRDLAVPGLLPHRGQDEGDILRDWLARCDLYLPDVADALRPSVDRVSDRLAARLVNLRPCHRDLHEKQILLANGVAGLLDFDTLSLADPALDPGNLAAHLFMAGVPDDALRLAFDLPGLSLWRQAALLRLAMIYAFTSTTPSTLGRLISEACRDDRD